MITIAKMVPQKKKKLKKLCSPRHCVAIRNVFKIPNLLIIPPNSISPGGVFFKRERNF